MPAPVGASHFVGDSALTAPHTQYQPVMGKERKRIQVRCLHIPTPGMNVLIMFHKHVLIKVKILKINFKIRKKKAKGAPLNVKCPDSKSGLGSTGPSFFSCKV